MPVTPTPVTLSRPNTPITPNTPNTSNIVSDLAELEVVDKIKHLKNRKISKMLYVSPNTKLENKYKKATNNRLTRSNLARRLELSLNLLDFEMQSIKNNIPKISDNPQKII